MRLKLLLIFAFLLATVGCTTVASYEYTVCVTSERDLGQNLLLPPDCYSLDNVSALVNNSTLIQFNTNEVKLTRLVTFQRKKSISIIGHDGNTMISCLPPNHTSTSSGVGLAFIAVENLTLANLTFQYCGAVYDSTTAHSETSHSTLLLRSSIYILNCTDVNVINVSIRRSKGNGLAFFDTSGTVNIENSTFEENRVPELEVLTYPGGGGVHVEFTYCTLGHYKCNWLSAHKRRLSGNIKYTFQNCHFLRNNADPENTGFVQYANGTHFHGFGKGGGLCVIVKGAATNNTVNITNCVFQENSAIWGGGLYVVFQDSPKNNTIIIHNSTFESNNCYKYGGGGANVGYLFFKESPPQNNSVTFQSCSFTNNTAKYGGGIEFYSSQVKEIYCNLNNSIIFLNCTWKQNKAQYGSAVDISPHVWDTLSTGFLPVPVFENCTFSSNWVIYKHYFSWSKLWVQFKIGNGAFLAVGYRIQFKGTLLFQHNNGTAMYMTSSILEITAGANATFQNNSGFNGGAVALMGFSSIHICQ